ncbi:transcriptional regulator of TetR family [alpha proteobacterium U9-1i]|nr:transcriptional regulator of TetR family [alpha proteobacterium U9-1i]
MAKLSTAKTDLIDAAVELFRQRGYAGVGVADLLAAANAPRGSLYFHFPGGKEEIGVEAVRRFGDEATGRFRSLTESGVDMIEFIDRTFRYVAREAKTHRYEISCPLLAVASDVGADTPELGLAVRYVLASWEQEVARAAEQRGYTHDAAIELGSALVSAMEGATLTSKAHGTSTPFIYAGNAVKALAAQLAPR